MKQKRFLLLALCLALLTGCGAKQPPTQEEQPPAVEQETPEDEQETPEQPEASEGTPETPEQKPEAPAQRPQVPNAPQAYAALFDALPLELVFASGAGAWCTELTLERDGTFAGMYHDSEMGDCGEGYPNGSCYVCAFSGSFADLRQVDEHTWSMTLDTLNTEETPDTEWIEDDIRYIASEPYGMEGGKEFYLYSPETPTEALDENFLSWWPVWNVEGGDTLGCWGLWNQEMGCGFFTDL